jgi:hypothetical protein
MDNSDVFAFSRNNGVAITIVHIYVPDGIEVHWIGALELCNVVAAPQIQVADD